MTHFFIARVVDSKGKFHGSFDSRSHTSFGTGRRKFRAHVREHMRAFKIRHMRVDISSHVYVIPKRTRQALDAIHVAAVTHIDDKCMDVDFSLPYAGKADLTDLTDDGLEPAVVVREGSRAAGAPKPWYHVHADGATLKSFRVKREADEFAATYNGSLGLS